MRCIAAFEMNLSVPMPAAPPEARESFRFLVKLGYAVKGCVYALLGVLALRVGLGDGGRVAGEDDAMRQVARYSFGEAWLVAIAAGLFFYALWRFLEAVADPHRVGHSLRGLAQRTGALISAVGNGVVALTALQLALGERAGGKSAKIWAALALREEWGPALLVIVGASIAGVGVFHVYEAWTGRFCDRLDLSRSSRTWRSYVTWSGRVGLVARGSLFAIIGVAAIHAGASLNPHKAKGLREALLTFVEQPFGNALLVSAAVGLLAYALHLVSTAPIRKLGA
jgi:hypothetical protein